MKKKIITKYPIFKINRTTMISIIRNSNNIGATLNLKNKKTWKIYPTSMNMIMTMSLMTMLQTNMTTILMTRMIIILIATPTPMLIATATTRLIATTSRRLVITTITNMKWKKDLNQNSRKISMNMNMMMGGTDH